MIIGKHTPAVIYGNGCTPTSSPSSQQKHGLLLVCMWRHVAIKEKYLLGLVVRESRELKSFTRALKVVANS